MWSPLAVVITMYENTHCLMCADTKAAKKSMQLLVQKFLAEIIAYLQNQRGVSAQIENEMWAWLARSSRQCGTESFYLQNPSFTFWPIHTPILYEIFFALLECCHTSHFSLCYIINQHRHVWSKTEWSVIVLHMLSELLNPVLQQSTWTNMSQQSHISLTNWFKLI